jgi:hypothetical protein
MGEILNLGREIEVVGKSGNTYNGKLHDKKSESTLTGRAIVCLTDSHFHDSQWHHHMNAVYMTENAQQAFDDFKKRDDISNLILIPIGAHDFSRTNKVEDLIHSYVHK